MRLSRNVFNETSKVENSYGRSLAIGAKKYVVTWCGHQLRHRYERPYRLVDNQYERRSIAISSNLHPSGFDQLMDKNLATALVDRLLHHAHVVLTDGESVRLADATSGKGVMPLAN